MYGYLHMPLNMAAMVRLCALYFAIDTGNLMTSKSSLPQTLDPPKQQPALVKAPLNPWRRFGPGRLSEGLVGSSFVGFAFYVKLWEPSLGPWLAVAILGTVGFSKIRPKLFGDTMSWRLRHWSGAELLAFYGGNSPFMKAGKRNLLALLMDPDTAEPVPPRDDWSPDLAEQQVFVYDTVQALVRGMPRQSLLLIADERQRIGTEAVGYGYIHLIEVVELMAEIMTGTLSSAQLKQLEQLKKAAPHRDALTTCFATWALAHYHLAEGRKPEAESLFEALAEKAPSLRVLHAPVGTPITAAGALEAGASVSS